MADQKVVESIKSYFSAGKTEDEITSAMVNAGYNYPEIKEAISAARSGTPMAPNAPAMLVTHPQPKRPKLPVVIAIIVLMALGAGAYWFFVGAKQAVPTPGASAGATQEITPFNAFLSLLPAPAGSDPFVMYEFVEKPAETDKAYVMISVAGASTLSKYLSRIEWMGYQTFNAGKARIIKADQSTYRDYSNEISNSGGMATEDYRGVALKTSGTSAYAIVGDVFVEGNKDVVKNVIDAYKGERLQLPSDALGRLGAPGQVVFVYVKNDAPKGTTLYSARVVEDLNGWKTKIIVTNEDAAEAEKEVNDLIDRIKPGVADISARQEGNSFVIEKTGSDAKKVATATEYAFQFITARYFKR